MKKQKQGESTLEYMLVAVVVAIGALLIFGIFGDTIKEKAGAILEKVQGNEK